MYNTVSAEERRARNQALRQRGRMKPEANGMRREGNTVSQPGAASRANPTAAPSTATSSTSRGNLANRPIFRSRNAPAKQRPSGVQGVAGGGGALGAQAPQFGGPRSQASSSTHAATQQGGAQQGAQRPQPRSGVGAPTGPRGQSGPQAGFNQTIPVDAVMSGDPGGHAPGAPQEGMSGGVAGYEAPGEPGYDDTAEPGWGQTTQDLWEEAIREMLLNGERDTTAEEEAAREQIMAAASGATRDARARMGAAGFGASGALASLQGDFNRQAEMDAVDAILGIQAGARDEFRDDLFGAIGATQGQQQLDLRKEVWEKALEAYGDYLDGDDLPDEPPEGSGVGGAPATAEELREFADYYGFTGQYEGARDALGGAMPGNDVGDAYDTPPEGATPGEGPAEYRSYTDPVTGQRYEIWWLNGEMIWVKA